MSIKKYYEKKGDYLEEHKDYFTKQQLIKDISFITSGLHLKKQDKILDLACGHGRHTIALKKKGYDIDGLDFSQHLLNIAQETVEQEGLKIKFYKQDIHKIKLNKKYDKIILFFSEFGLFNSDVVLKNVKRTLTKNGSFLLDCDNVFRLVKYLTQNPRAPYKFDFVNMTLNEKKSNAQSILYYTPKDLIKLFEKHGFKIENIFGDYQKNKLSPNSKRIIIIGRKTT